MRRSELVPRLLFAGLLSLPLLATAQGGPDFKVELDPETCAFSGGSDGAGNVETAAGSGNRMIQVRLSHQDYAIAEVRFSGDGADQMVHAGGGEAHVVNIFNRNSGPADVKYSVIVQHQGTGETRDCDPRIINR